MGQDFTTPPQQELFIAFASSFPVKDRIIAGKTEDPHPMYKGYLPEHKIPERIGIEIFQCDPEEAIGVFREDPFVSLQTIRRTSYRGPRF